MKQILCMFSYFVLSSVDKKTELTLRLKGQNETQAGCLSELSCLTPLYLAKVLDLYHEIVLASESLPYSMSHDQCDQIWLVSGFAWLKNFWVGWFWTFFHLFIHCQNCPSCEVVVIRRRPLKLNSF